MHVEVTALLLPGADRPALRSAVESYVGPTTRLCPRCGSAAHGRPHARRHGPAHAPADSPADPAPTHLSIAYAPGLAVVARADGPVGVDVEPADRTPPPGVPDLAAWTRVEAVLKLTGEGLARDPAGVGDDEAERVVAQPLPLGTLPGPAHVGTVATRGPARLVLRTVVADVSDASATLTPPAAAAVPPRAARA